MEDEAAEIELLEQNLNKTRQISQRMISILTNFDTRLVKLEKTILPLHNSTQLLYRRAANIDGTLQLIDEVASSQQGLAEEEAIILRGPQSTQLATYIDALERMNASIAFKGTSGDSRDTARLVEAGSKKLAQLYTKLVAEASSGTPLARTSFDNNASAVIVPFPEDIVQTLRPLVSFLRTLPLPATHPSHPAAGAIQTALSDAQRGYADMRGTWMRKCLEVDAKRVVEGRGDGYGSGKDTDGAETGIREGQEFGVWVEGVIVVAETDYNLLAELALLPSGPQLTGTYASLITPVLTLLSSSLAQLTNRVKRSLQQNMFLALSAHAHLASADVTRRWEDVIKRRAVGSTANVNVLKEGLHSLRAVCLRSFPEFLADIRLAAVPNGEVGTDVAEITETVIKYMTSIPAVQGAVGASLLTLGDGNWKMGEGVQVSKGPKLGEGDENIVLEHYFYDIIMTTLSTLTTLARSSFRPAFGAIFFLNNVSYLLSALLYSPTEAAPVEALLAPPARNALQSGFRTAKAGYFDANFSPLLQALGDGPGSGGGSGKAAVKEKFTRFFDLFDDIVERHRTVRVLPDDQRSREALAEEAVKLVIPSLQRFVQKNKDFSKNPQKYIKMSPEEIETQIRKLY